jgi:hypothetical protein
LETITATTKFDDNVRLGIDFEEKEIKPKTWEAGIFSGTDSGIYGQGNLYWREWLVGVRVEIGTDNRLLVITGKKF